MGVNYGEIIERMRWAGKLKNDSAVARTLGVTPQALSNYKKRGEMPTDLALRFANLYGLSVDWLITGEGEMYRVGREAGRGLYAAEETAPYGAEFRAADLSSLSPDEIIYVGKLLKILRCPNRTTSAAMRYSVDAFLRAVEAPEPQEKK